MAKRLSLTCPCPACGAERQGLVVIRALNRRWLTKCSRCGVDLESEMGFGAYLLLGFYTQAVVFLVALPLVLGLIAREWLIAAMAFAIFLALVLPPAMILHARRMRLKSE